MTRNLFIALLTVLFLSTGCKLIYKQNVQQGNAHEQEDLDQLELGMTKKQVAFLLGTPAVHDPFHQDRWDYISMLSRRGGEPVRRLVTLTFENDLLVMTDGVGDSTGGDIKALAGTQAAVAGIDDVETAKATQLLTDDGVIDWTIQLGAFNTHEEAVEFAGKVRSKGYEARLMEQIVPGLGTRHQVRSGLFDTYNEAFTALRAMEKDLDVAGITVPVDVPKEP
ncbi:MAG: outer membrane protein assembly factor BamE [Xanthomonadales bacterium]|nr:outer membrane protein assembly factor BamE [Gammaproteobacteria bacterium]MBT8073425.1 outer membrane protein assembly factor BamE [Gammaproteobacteria bacterium]NNK04268.1 outer membrane protein assembly factor BamE [Xanthomonadales bacterium]NNK99715.1 outer membrane protein assembly factor BamE [Xanthomonadales bacterium]